MKLGFPVEVPFHTSPGCVREQALPPGAEGDQLAVHQQDGVKNVRRRVQVVMGGDDQPSFRRQGIQQPPQGLAGRGVQPCEGFVQQQDVGFLRQGARQECPLLLPSGKF